MSLNFSSTKKIPQNAAEHNKLTKVTSWYSEINEFNDSDTSNGYFCYNCEYFIKSNLCIIVTEEGQDINGNISNKILPYAVCSLWTPNEKMTK